MGAEFLHSNIIYEGRAFNLSRDTVRLPDGRETIYEVVQHSGAVTLVPVDDHGRIWFVRQYRSGVRGPLLELPAGTLEPGEEPQACAAREVREEIGQAAKNLTKIGSIFLAPGYSTEYMHFYLATNLYAAALAADDDEFLETEAIAVPEVFRMVGRNELNDGKTLAGLLLARPYLAERFKLDKDDGER
jgi:ADP-ribose pyrophosphatase